MNKICSISLAFCVILTQAILAQNVNDSAVPIQKRTQYISLRPGEAATLTMKKGWTLTFQRYENHLMVLCQNPKDPVEITPATLKQEDNKDGIWLYHLTNGKIDSTAWTKIADSYHVEIHTPAGIFRTNEYMVWNSREKLLYIIHDKTYEEKLTNIEARYPEKFKGSVAYDHQNGMKIDLEDGGASFQLPSGHELMFHISPGSVEMGLQYPVEIPSSLTNFGKLIEEIKSQEEDVRNVGPGQS